MTLHERLSSFWFAPLPPERLALTRILIGGFAMHRTFTLSRAVLRRADLQHALVRPVGLMELLDHRLSPLFLRIVLATAIVGGVCFVFGLWHRWLSPLFAAALLLLGSFRNSFGMIYHTDQLLVLHVIVLALAPAADAWSVDAWMRARTGAPPPEAGGSYGWPIRLLCVLAMSIYWLAGVAKLSAHGWDWALGHALRAQIGKDALRKQLLGHRAGPLATWIMQHGWAATGLGVGTMILELGAPLFLIGSRARRLWAVTAFCMHWGVLLIMGITFNYQLCGVAFAPFFAVQRPVQALVRAARTRYAARVRRQA